jgi:hypothetical protein
MRCALLKLPSSSARIENCPRASLLAVRGWEGPCCGSGRRDGSPCSTMLGTSHAPEDTPDGKPSRRTPNPSATSRCGKVVQRSRLPGAAEPSLRVRSTRVHRAKRPKGQAASEGPIVLSLGPAFPPSPTRAGSAKTARCSSPRLRLPNGPDAVGVGIENPFPIGHRPALRGGAGLRTFLSIWAMM